MRISDILGMSLTNLWRRKVRTILTVLGVIIGTASIVVMLSLGLGLKEAMMEQVSTAGGLTEILVYTDGDYGTDGDLLLSDDTIDTFMEIEHVDSVEPQLYYSMPLKAGKYEAEDVPILGVTREYMEKMELESGSIPESNTNVLSLIIGNQVLGDCFYDAATGVYPYWEMGELPDVDLMKTPLIGGISIEESYADPDVSDTTTDMAVANDVDPIFTDDADSFSDDTDDFSDSSEDFSTDDIEDDSIDTSEDFSEDDIDDDFLDADDYDEENINYSAFTSDVKRVQVAVAGITAGGPDDYTEYSYYCYADMDSLKTFLKKNYSENDIIPGQPIDKNGKPYRDLKYSQFIVNVDESSNVEDVLQTIQDMGYRGEANKEWLEEIEKEFMIIEAVLGGIGAVAMLVAAISIANTMTMSTYERTKEIGVMKVLGCSLGNIRSMFLSEAAFIGLLGGVAGILLSYILSIVLNQVVAPVVMSDYGSGVSISVIPFWLVLAAILFSTIIGMVAGFFPAQRATKLSPLAAIRNE
ncbi:MAG: FtsX-like permease family protein [Lachnospiraceae bacterium]